MEGARETSKREEREGKGKGRGREGGGDATKNKYYLNDPFHPIPFQSTVKGKNLTRK